MVFIFWSRQQLVPVTGHWNRSSTSNKIGTYCTSGSHQCCHALKKCILEKVFVYLLPPRAHFLLIHVVDRLFGFFRILWNLKCNKYQTAQAKLHYGCHWYIATTDLQSVISWIGSSTPEMKVYLNLKTSVTMLLSMKADNICVKM